MQQAPVYLDRSFAFIVVAHARRAVVSIIMRRRLLSLSALKYLKRNLPHVSPMALARCMSLRWPDVSLSTNGKEIYRTAREENEIRVLSIVDAPRRF